MEDKKKKILFADLDGTLIETLSGKTFPIGIWDMMLRTEVLDKIKYYGFERLVIITNQGGIETGHVNEDHFVNGKLNYLSMALQEYIGIPVSFQCCPSNDKGCWRRKPNPGMIEDALKEIGGIFKKDELLMIGDASGKEGQFSDSDLKTAENMGIDYVDVNDFILEA